MSGARAARAPRVKICGITREDDARLACELGADLIGFVLWPRSPRAVSVDRAHALAAALPPHVARVGVFVDAGVEELCRAAAAIGLDVVQLHGEEAPGLAGALPCRVIKAMSVAQAGAGFGGWPPSVLPLLDAIDAQARGGTGRRVDWSAAARLARARPLLLSGGITAGNVVEAIATVRPWGVDVSSGVEAAPGFKDPLRLRAFFEAVRAATAATADAAAEVASRSGRPPWWPAACEEDQ
jgi:phosphoribosylanthranilate isomerase